ncbi:SpoIIE family protein phosphatase [Coriobacteriia bacterium Es71-Z0120]|uniref:SpoIIE family protein phosphatase n=1 Tax=Parvivirga hydrogeniphila TaxID=2939460 RepID=UPI002260A0D7|nr:SpoIIE family protein phosphatase [Parvivirga hydrogeniphila]MCL4078886.1 SpoIIE family protein phosphatase [Parvivirga hydrogeniphila]
MDRMASKAGALAGYLPGAIALSALLSTLLYSYGLFHTLAEIFAIAVQFALFTVVWHSRRHLDDGALVVIGTSAAPIAAVGALHLLSYVEIGLITSTAQGFSAQLWIAARFLQAAALLAASWFEQTRPAAWKALAASTIATGVVVGAAATNRLPLSADPLTAAIDAAIVVALLVALYRFWSSKAAFAPAVGRRLLWAVGLAAAAETLFALGGDPGSASHVVGHVVRIAAAYALYRAVVVSVLEQPQATLFREISLRNAQLEETDRALRSAKERSDAMLAVSTMIARAEPLDAVIERALELGANAMGADGAALTAKRGGGWVVTHAYGFDRTVIGMRREGPSAHHLLLAHEKRSPVIVNEPALDPRVDREFVSRFGVTSLLVAPLVARNEVFGALTFIKRRGRAGFSEQDRGFSARLATSLGLAISNDRMQSAQSRVADALRSAILTMPDALPGVQLGHVYRSADRIAKIGGDFYDAFSLADGRHAVLMGDVSGKGIDAAVSSFVTRTAFHALALREPSPARVMAAANDVLARLLPDEAFATAIFGVIDVQGGTFTAASAGHPDPVICTLDGCVEHDAVRNLPLGMFPETEYEQFSLPLTDGEVLVMFSDGVLDARRGQEPFGEWRVREVLDSARLVDPQAIAEMLLDAVTAHADGTHVDDIAIVALRLEEAPR